MSVKNAVVFFIVSLIFYIPNKQCNAQTTLNLSDGNMVISSGINLVIDGDLKNSADGNDAILLSGEIDIIGDFTNNASSGNLLSGSTGNLLALASKNNRIRLMFQNIPLAYIHLN